MTPGERLSHAAAEYRAAAAARDERHARWGAMPSVECRGRPCREQIWTCASRALCEGEGRARLALHAEVVREGRRVAHWRDAVLAAARLAGIDGRG